METKSTHLLVELWGCDAETLNDSNHISVILQEAADAAGATVRGLDVHRFEPQGVSGVAVVAESHISIHTWPERSYAAADIFTCGESCDPRAGAAKLRALLDCSKMTIVELERGHEDGVKVIGSVMVGS